EDVNKDGKLDAVVTLRGPSNAVVFAVCFGDGKGNLLFNANTIVPIAPGENQAGVPATLGDFNGAGKLDPLAPNAPPGTVHDTLGTGNGTFVSGPTFAVAAEDNSFLAGDVNGDGKTDLLSYPLYSNGSVNGATVHVSLGDGHGGFQRAPGL